jgi:dolichyl-phosphate beta-glucosyltransferase
MDVLQSILENQSETMNISITIPAHNEEGRIGKTLDAYHEFFSQKAKEIEAFSYEFIVVLNGCRDNTLAIVQERSDQFGDIKIIDFAKAGKGLAVKVGFEDALTRKNDLIGFVDADMATRPQQFWDLITNLGKDDGCIAGRYMPGSQIFPKRPPIKEWGRRLVYQPFVWLLFGLNYYDHQCGAKLFARRVIQEVVPFLTVTEWAFDVELLYICKKMGFVIKERPTTWYDQVDSKFSSFREHRMLTALVKARWRYGRSRIKSKQ